MEQKIGVPRKAIFHMYQCIKFMYVKDYGVESRSGDSGLMTCVHTKVGENKLISPKNEN